MGELFLITASIYKEQPRRMENITVVNEKLKIISPLLEVFEK